MCNLSHGYKDNMAHTKQYGRHTKKLFIKKNVVAKQYFALPFWGKCNT